MRPIVVSALILAALPGLADAVEPMPPSSWRLMAVECDEDTVIWIAAEREGPAVAVAMSYRDGALFNRNYFWLPGRDLAFRAEAGGVAEGLRKELRHDSTHYGTGAFVPANEAMLVFVGTFGAVQGAFIDYPKVVCRIEVLSQGPSHASTGEDLGGGDWVSVTAYGPTAHYASGRKLDLSIENTLIGWFGMPQSLEYVGIENITLSSDAGRADACPCRFSEFAGPDARGPGEYHLDMSGIGASALNDLPLIGWADVDFPD